MADVAFELHFPDGRKITIHTDGIVHGVPEGTAIVNRLHGLFCYLQERQIPPGRYLEATRNLP